MHTAFASSLLTNYNFPELDLLSCLWVGSFPCGLLAAVHLSVGASFLPACRSWPPALVQGLSLCALEHWHLPITCLPAFLAVHRGLAPLIVSPCSRHSIFLKWQESLGSLMWVLCPFWLLQSPHAPLAYLSQSLLGCHLSGLPHFSTLLWCRFWGYQLRPPPLPLCPTSRVEVPCYSYIYQQIKLTVYPSQTVQATSHNCFWVSYTLLSCRNLSL